MRFSISDDDALTFSKVFLWQLRTRHVRRGGTFASAALAGCVSSRSGLSVFRSLYLLLLHLLSGFMFKAGNARLSSKTSRSGTVRAAVYRGNVQGRIAELTTLGKAMTGNNHPRLITIHGGDGQGKTALARTAAKRFAFAWPDGVWAGTWRMCELVKHSSLTYPLSRYRGDCSERA